jgi:hypothetical protein
MVVLRPELADRREDAILLDEAPRQLDGVRGVVRVVVELPDDLPTVDAALAVDPAGVDVAEVGLHPDRDRRIGRRRAGEREGAADGDGSGCDTWCLLGRATERSRHRQRERGYQADPAHDELSHRCSSLWTLRVPACQLRAYSRYVTAARP